MARLPIPGQKKAPQELTDGVKTEERTRTNRTCSPPVTIKTIKTFSFRVFGQNLYYRNGQLLEPKSLTALEKGHVYQAYYFSSLEPNIGVAGPGYRINSLRITDEETADLLSGLTPYNSDQALRSGKWASAADNPKAFDFSFYLLESDFLEFRRRVETLGGRITSRDPVSALSNAKEGLEDIRFLVEGFEAAFQQYYSEVTGLTHETPIEEYERILNCLTALKGVQSELFQKISEFQSNVTMARERQDQEAQVTILETHRSSLQGRFDAVRQANLNILETEIKHRLQARLENRPVAPGPVFSLSSELARLSKVFPILEKIQANSNSEILIEVGQVKVKLSLEGAQILGDPVEIERLAHGARFVQQGGGGGRFGDI